MRPSRPPIYSALSLANGLIDALPFRAPRHLQARQPRRTHARRPRREARSFTARSIAGLIKVSRTIADLRGQDEFDTGCLLETAAYRDVDPSAGLVPHVM